MLHCKRCKLPVPELPTWQELQLCIRCDWEEQCPAADRETIDFYVGRTQALNEIRIAEKKLIDAWRRLLATPDAEMYYGHTMFEHFSKLDRLLIQKVIGEERIYELAAIAKDTPFEAKPYTPDPAPMPITPQAAHLKLIGGPSTSGLAAAYGATLLGHGR